MFHVLLQGEDRTEFTIQTDGRSPDEARLEAEELYPEARILEVFDPVVREQEIYERVCRRMDDEDVYYDDY